MNVADSQRLARSLENLGLIATIDPKQADLIVLNTCVVRQSAENKALGRLNSLRPLKNSNPELILCLMGCLIGFQGNPALQQKFPWVDVFAAPSDPTPLLDYLTNHRSGHDAESWRRTIDSVLDQEFGVNSSEGSYSVSENLPIVLGCSNACSYCVIPGKRGKERSRDFNKILQEANQFVSHGTREIVLLGQIIDRYGLDIPGNPQLPDLLESLSNIRELKRLRFLTSHPNWMTDRLIKTIADVPKVMPHVEVPIQSGNNEILMAMRRGYSNQEYRELVAKLREIIPGVSIATDVIVGFPGETEKEFQNTFDLLSDLKLDVAHLARYSPRPGTYSARFLEDSVPETEKMRRYRVLEDLQEEITAGINSGFLDQVQPVLFERKVKSRWQGRSPTNRIVFVESTESLTGQLCDVKITWTGPWSLLGELV